MSGLATGSHNNGGGGGPVYDPTLKMGIVILLCLYAAVMIRTWMNLPSLPDDLFAARGDQTHQDVLHNYLLHHPQQDQRWLSTTDFPQSIRNGKYDTLPHPAAEVMQHEMAPLRLPAFWNPTDQYDGDVRKFLGNYGERLMTPEEALAIGSHVPGEDRDALETIFVAIASYRDEECRHTVESIFARAAHPQRVRVAVVDQVEAGDVKCSTPVVPCDEAPQQALCRYRDSIDVWEMDAALAVGPVFARHIGHRMYRGEYFAMQCDAHVRFVAEWDVDIVQQWHAAHNEMAVLTAYLSDVQGSLDPTTGKSLRDTRPIMCKTDYEGSGPGKHLRHGQQPEGVPGIHGTPTLQPYWAAGFSFARGHFVVNVPYDQHLPMIFQGEEISIGLRAFSYGYDFYTPERSVCFHMYAVGANEAKRKAVSLFWEHANLYQGAGQAGMARLLGLIHMNPASVDPTSWLHDDEVFYGIGQVRSLSKFFDTFGIHTDSQTVEQHLCRFVGKPMQRLFLPQLRSNGMGIDYSQITFQFRDPDKGGKIP